MLTAVQKTGKNSSLDRSPELSPQCQNFFPTNMTSEAINGAITGVGISCTPSLAPKGGRQL